MYVFVSLKRTSVSVVCMYVLHFSLSVINYVCVCVTLLLNGKSANMSIPCVNVCYTPLMGRCVHKGVNMCSSLL